MQRVTIGVGVPSGVGAAIGSLLALPCVHDASSGIMNNPFHALAVIIQDVLAVAVVVDGRRVPSTKSR